MGKLRELRTSPAQDFNHPQEDLIERWRRDYPARTPTPRPAWAAQGDPGTKPSPG